MAEASGAPELYYVYVIELGPMACAGRAACPGHERRPPVYVGQSARTPEVRLQQHLDGHKAARIVRRHGIRLKPRLYRNYGPYSSRDGALRGESALAERLRRRGYCVFGGH